ncbi:glycosyltransferase family 4 protein [Desulfovibrio gilichinskyi]|uniref:Glycosyltransferase involved in cell wall bisynthesis n=1 Tax=Desulfovibrio gilichinskyi TaxID=1519643 RepID=A0A1X7EIP8_9BACT|nr:glycosyltransferase family 1 protein [Desulfovibrio gilichinskyi]SMF34661.1 Glycosyltransferase involved in cell wall bisynthesis [Desulfovibrio gilichinskyi]
MSKKVIYYDLSRLLNRSVASHATGIDRVDIRYAMYFLEDKESEFNGLIQIAGFYFVVEIGIVALFLNALFDKWMGNGCIDFNFEKFKRAQYDYGKKGAQGSYESINVELLNIFERNRTCNCLYFNCSHYGIADNIKVIQTMKVLGRIKFCYYLHDIIPIEFPEYVRDGDDLIHFDRVKVMLTYGDIIYVNSNYTRKQLQNFCNRYSFEPPFVVVTRIGVEDCFLQKEICKPRFLDKKILSKYFVYVSTIEPRKNHLLLLNVWRQIVEDVVDPPYLVLVGHRGWNNQIVFDMLDRALALKEYVIELNDIADADLVSLIKNAKAMLFPSFSEGWGMPLVESAALQVPVICSDIDVFHEAGQNMMKYINSIDGGQWKKTLIQFGDCTEERELIVRSLVTFDVPTWQDHFEQVEKGISCLEYHYSEAKVTNLSVLDDFKNHLRQMPKASGNAKVNVLRSLELYEIKIAKFLQHVEFKQPKCKIIFDLLRKVYWSFKN